MTILYGRCSIGAAGAVSSIVGDFSTITKETGTGNYSITLAAHANAFLFGEVMFASEADSVSKTALSGVSQVDVLTFVDKATSTGGDFFIVTDTAGAKWAFSINKNGPDILDKNVVTFPAKAAATEGDFIQLTDGVGGKWAIALDKDGSGVANAGPIYTASTAIVVDISAATDAASVGLAVFTALPAPFLAVFTATDNLDGTIDFEAKTAAVCAAAEKKDAAETGAGSITFAHTAIGIATTPEPTSALWTAIAAGNKTHVDISAQTTADDVCAAVRAAFAGLVGIGTTITVSAASTDHFSCTHVYRAPVAVPVGYKEAGAASPTSAAVSQTTLGVQTAYDITNTTGETIAFTTAHGWQTGRLVALSINSGALPTGWAAGNYYVIVDSATKIALASSLANAEAGTRVTISDYGDGGKTVTVAPVAPFGSAVGRAEFTSTTLKADVQQRNKIYFTCYDYTGSQYMPANGSKLYIALHVKTENESGAGV